MQRGHLREILRDGLPGLGWLAEADSRRGDVTRNRAATRTGRRQRGLPRHILSRRLATLTGAMVGLFGSTVAAGGLPPHMIDLGYGTLTCERDYVLRRGECIAFDDLPHGPVVEISELPSAGEGSRQPSAAWPHASSFAGYASVSSAVEPTCERSVGLASTRRGFFHSPATHVRAPAVGDRPVRAPSAPSRGARFMEIRR